MKPRFYTIRSHRCIGGITLTISTGTLAIAPLILSLVMVVDALAKEDTITLTESKAIADAMAINEALNQVSKKVMDCVGQKLAPPEKCFCLYPTEVTKVREKYEVALKNNPEWKDRIVF